MYGANILVHFVLSLVETKIYIIILEGKEVFIKGLLKLLDFSTQKEYVILIFMRMT